MTDSSNSNSTFGILAMALLFVLLLSAIIDQLDFGF
jgi:hypothetical protein